jgi:hypothetical protein
MASGLEHHGTELAAIERKHRMHDPQITHLELLTVFTIAADAVEADTPQHDELARIMGDVYERNFTPEEKEQAAADLALIAIEAGVKQTYLESPYRATVENILRTLGPDTTGEDLADYGNRIIEESASA